MPHNQYRTEKIDMIDTLSLQLREAEARRASIERAHKETLSQILNISTAGKVENELAENLQSKARELEKKVALETVRCEELQLELSSAMKSKYVRHSSAFPPHPVGTSVTWASNQDQSSEVELILAKIEQDDRVLAELEESRTSGTGKAPGSIKSAGSMDHKSFHKTAVTGSSTGLIMASSTIPNSSNGLSANNGLLIHSSINGSSNTSSSAMKTNANSYGDTISTGPTGMNIDSALSDIYSLKHIPSINQRGTVQLYNLQNTTLPILSFQNKQSAASTSFGLGLNGISVTTSYAHPNINNIIDSNSILSNCVGSNAVTTCSSVFGLTGAMPGFTTTYSSPYIEPGVTSLPYVGSTRNSKSKFLDDVDFSLMRYANRSSPCSPIPPSGTWGFDDYNENVNTNAMYSQRNFGIGSTLDLETREHLLNGASEPQVDMLDIPGKGRCCVFIARFSYDPIEEAEGELSLSTGDYLLVWSGGETHGGFLDAELLDGRRGLVPASFVQRLVGDDLLEFHQAVLSTLRDAEDSNIQSDTTIIPSLPANNPLLTYTSEDLARLNDSQTELENEGDIDDTVPAPKHLTLERQMNKSVLIGWSAGESINYINVESFHVYVDGVLKVTVKANERTRALIEGVDSTRPHRISVRSVAQNRKTSRDAACTMIIGRDTSHLGPSAVRASNITCSSALISWLPANSNHQHIICVNNVEVRVVKPGIYRHTITGLSPSTQYRVTVRAKHLRASGRSSSQGGRAADEAPGAYSDFRTLSKGLPDPPQDIQLEAGPQEGTILVTWQPVSRPSSSGPVSGYAVYADGKKVTDVNSPTGDHALIEIGKLAGLNPKAVTIRTKSRDLQSKDSTPILIPNAVRVSTMKKGPVTIMASGRNNGATSNPSDHDGQITQGIQQQGHHPAPTPRNTIQARPNVPCNMQQQQPFGNQQIMNQNRSAMAPGPRMPFNGSHQQGPQLQQQQQQQQQRKPRYFIAMFDYDPSTMSPNPDGCEEELPFREGETIKVYGDKDCDGFYWGELQGRRGYVPHNMVTEVDETQATTGGSAPPSSVPLPTSVPSQSMRNISRDRWGDIYANTSVQRMIALYDYDPQELSPNVDAEQVELSFRTGEIILVYGDMDEDGFFMGELDGVRGLVPSNFLAEAPEQFNNQMTAGGSNMVQRNMNNRSKGQGPGARGPPPPPRDHVISTQANPRHSLRKDVRPASPTHLDNMGHPTLDHLTQVNPETGGVIIGGNSNSQYQHSMSQQDFDAQQYNEQPQLQKPSNASQQTGSGLFSGATSLLSGATQAATGGLFGSKPKTDQSNLHSNAQPEHQQAQSFGGIFGSSNQQQQQNQQQQSGQGPGFISKLNEMTAPGSEILSKAKDSFFGKFGFGK